jgi:hypothetical protein
MVMILVGHKVLAIVGFCILQNISILFNLQLRCFHVIMNCGQTIYSIRFVIDSLPLACGAFLSFLCVPSCIQLDYLLWKEQFVEWV